jgi:putative lipoic acid-binding regulatory protein
MNKSGFKKLLEENYKWPCLYMFKFICPAKNENIAHLESLFNSESSEVIIRQSSKGNFVSITAKEIMLSPENVLNRYKEVEQIPGLLSL